MASLKNDPAVKQLIDDAVAKATAKAGKDTIKLVKTAIDEFTAEFDDKATVKVLKDLKKTVGSLA